ncbi:hypothetical protein PbJCM13498_33410 [Prolixibacter bellariivorans]|uniref:Uncharacterized protein n=1 Tax=Prolixibacter bellariivorans TaxID=314319 RepID=A0A5M4B3H6_9BACT|nr:hypothetical protein PbJCM13498_33410 [Prolixibacter bellariivorans]
MRTLNRYRFEYHTSSLNKFVRCVRWLLSGTNLGVVECIEIVFRESFATNPVMAPHIALAGYFGDNVDDHVDDHVFQIQY